MSKMAQDDGWAKYIWAVTIPMDATLLTDQVPYNVRLHVHTYIPDLIHLDSLGARQDLVEIVTKPNFLEKWPLKRKVQDFIHSYLHRMERYEKKNDCGLEISVLRTITVHIS